MKLKITISGPKVHEVGYRYFLMSMAMSRRIRRFDAQNIDGEKEQEVEILIEGDEEKVAAFKELVQTKRPERARISNISFQDYTDDVMSIGEYAQFCTTVQMNKAIPILLSINDKIERMDDNLGGKMDQLLEKQDETVSEIRDLREDLVRRDNSERLVRIEKDIRVIKSKLSIR